MPMYVYHATGHPVGFLSGNIIHDLEGDALGRILGSHVYRLDGTYVGEWFKETVVAKPISLSPRRIAELPRPRSLPSPGPSFNRRGVIDYGHPDVFHLLYQPAPANDAELMDAAQ